jgi:hypothetical protein
VAALLLALGVSACLPLTPVTRTVTYSIAIDGAVVSDVNELARVAEETYASLQGWRAAGILFQRVASGGDFTLVLATRWRSSGTTRCAASCTAARSGVMS